MIDLWTDEFAFLSRPGQADIQIELFYDYHTNIASYPAWLQGYRRICTQHKCGCSPLSGRWWELARIKARETVF
jgi:hypothetical protein